MAGGRMTRLKYFLLGSALVMASFLSVHRFDTPKLVAPVAVQRFDLDIYDNPKRWEGKSPGTNIIILTYMRSGSTLTGQLLEHHPDVFYVFEPMHSLKWIWWSKLVRLNFFNQKSRGIKTSDAFSVEAVKTANGFLKCNFADLDLATLSQVQLKLSNDTAPYHECIKSKAGGVKSMIPCLDILYESCSKSRVTAFKTIRFPMKAVETMMVSNPLLKVVHLIRDPRPTINSQISHGRAEGKGWVQYSQEFCNRVEEDLEATQRMMKRYPGRVMLLQYEDLTRNPVEHVKELYSFAGLKYTKETANFVQSLTSSETEKSCSMCVQSKNSTERSLKWRNTIPYAIAHTIDKNCQKLYKSLGYIAVKSANHLTDLGSSLKIKRNI